MGLDSRQCTPEFIRIATQLGAETRSFERAAVTMKYTLGFGLSAKTIERLIEQVGEELSHDHAQDIMGKEIVIPEVAVVSCDGGRIRTREPGRGPGVHDPAWRETKNASFEKMTSSVPLEEDPCPRLPDTFRQVSHVANIAETAPFSVECSPEQRLPYQGPKRVLRTCLSSMARSCEFGHQMERESRRRRFGEASRRVFIGDSTSARRVGNSRNSSGREITGRQSTQAPCRCRAVSREQSPSNGLPSVPPRRFADY